jgi:FMN phosphatase YigB (HAD superfamily)
MSGALCRIDALCFDWGGTLMDERGPQDRAMALWPRVRRIDGALELLQALQGRCAVHVATNATVSRRPAIEKALARAGLRPYVGEIFCYTELGLRKEQPAFWAHVCAALGVAPQRLGMVGDTLEADVLAPARAGLQSLWFNEGGLRAMPQPRVPMVTHLAQVPDWLAGVPG